MEGLFLGLMITRIDMGSQGMSTPGVPLVCGGGGGRGLQGWIGAKMQQGGEQKLGEGRNDGGSGRELEGALWERGIRGGKMSA